MTRPIAAGIVIALTLILAVFAAHGALTATLDGLAAWRYPETLQQYDSARRQIRAQVPAGAVVAIGVEPDVEWSQRLPEFALENGDRVVDDPADAQYLLTARRTGHRVRIVVRRS